MTARQGGKYPAHSLLLQWPPLGQTEPEAESKEAGAQPREVISFPGHRVDLGR